MAGSSQILVMTDKVAAPRALFYAESIVPSLSRCPVQTKLLILLLSMLVAGCAAPPVLATPPLKASFRPAQIPTRGMVAGVNNASGSIVTVETVFVRSKDDAQERSYRLDRKIAPRDSITIGWVELDGWKLRTGDRLRLACEGYRETFDFTVEKAQP
jgi:hypothetical protein